MEVWHRCNQTEAAAAALAAGRRSGSGQPDAFLGRALLSLDCLLQKGVRSFGKSTNPASPIDFDLNDSHPAVYEIYYTVLLLGNPLLHPGDCRNIPSCDQNAEQQKAYQIPKPFSVACAMTAPRCSDRGSERVLALVIRCKSPATAWQCSQGTRMWLPLRSRNGVLVGGVEVSLHLFYDEGLNGALCSR